MFCHYLRQFYALRFNNSLAFTRIYVKHRDKCLVPDIDEGVNGGTLMMSKYHIHICKD